MRKRHRRVTLRPRPLKPSERTTPPYWRPVKRSDCEKGPRPCPFFGCRYHLGMEHRQQPYLDQQPNTGLLVFPFGNQVQDLLGMRHTCALDAAAEGDRSGFEVAALMGISRQRGNQIEQVALRKLREALSHLPDDTLHEIFAHLVASPDEPPDAAAG